MPGFRVTNFRTSVPLVNYDDSRCQKDRISFEGWHFERNTLNKFLADKIFIETNQYFVLLEGITYNSQVLNREEKEHCFEKTFVKLLERFGDRVLQILDGSCAGVVFYKKEKRLIVFTSRLGEKAVFYYLKNNKIIVGSQLNYVTDILKDLGLEKVIDEQAFSQFLGYGFYVDESTCVKDIKRLYPGTYLEIQDNVYNVHEYNKIEYPEITNRSVTEWIELLHESFLKGIKKILEKNKEYGYSNLVDVSGGADSRMICCAVKELDERNVLLDCYGESGCADVVIAEQVANLLGYTLVFRSLDNAQCMMHIDENILLNNGATIYYGITGGKAMLEMFHNNLFGLELTGLLGDMYDGSMVTTYPGIPIDENYARFRCSDILRYGDDFIFPEKENLRFKINPNELFWFHARGMLFGMTSYFIRQNFVEVATPFGDKDFLQVYLSIPWSLRVKNNLLRKWMIQKYPAAANIKYAATGTTIKETVMKYGALKGKQQIAKRKLLSMLNKKPIGMNDLAYWYRTNYDFAEYVRLYFGENIELVEHKGIRRKIERLFDSRKIGDKLLAVTGISVYKNYIV